MFKKYNSRMKFASGLLQFSLQFQRVSLLFQAIRIQQKIVNTHGQYAVFIIQRSRSVGGDNDLFERIIDLQK